MLGFIQHHGLALLFGVVFVEQLGVPLPALPVLVPVGALAAGGRLSFPLALATCVAACLLADGIWYWLGRRHGSRVLRLLCRISLEPDSCVRQAENALAARGARALLYAKFVPGLSTVAPPVAGLIGMRPSHFLLWDAAGAILWAGAYLGLGWVFRGQAMALLDHATALGGRFAGLVAAAAALWLLWKYAQRQRFIRQLRVDRIEPEELRRRLDAGEDIAVFDLRSSADFDGNEVTLPGARRVPPELLDEKLPDFVPVREVVLFCT